MLEAAGQLQVWGHTESWTGTGIVRSIEPRLAWRFELVETYHEDGPGCQGWHIRAMNPAGDTAVEFLNRCTVGCTTPPNWGDVPGSYEIVLEQDSLAVYRDGEILRRLYNNGLGLFVLEFRADNMYGSGHHCHIFMDDVWGQELTQ